MLNIEFFKKSEYFKDISLTSWDVLFDEWDIDNNLYLVESWELSIEKYTSSKRDNTKVLAVLKDLDTFWEWSLNNSDPKQVKVVAKTDTKLLALDAKTWLTKFIENNPKEALALFKYLVGITNTRLLESNSLVTATYEIERKINSLDNITIKSIFEIIDSIRDIVSSDYVLYLEKNEIVDNSLLLKYDTRQNMKLLDDVIDFKWKDLVAEDLGDYKENYNYIQELTVWDRYLWYLVFCNKNHDFTENNKKIILSISASLSGIIRQREIFDEARDMEYMKWE